MRAVTDEVVRLVLAADLELFARFQLEREAMGEWADAPFSRGAIRVTLVELGELFEDYLKLLSRYKRADKDIPRGARTVLTRFFAFAAPAAPTHEDASG